MRKQILSGLASAALVSGLSAPVMSDVSATAGFVSDYVYRGAKQGDAGAYASVDYEQSGFYAGAWTIMDGGLGAPGAPEGEESSNTGLEVDYYLGYGMEMDNSLNFSVGYSAYTYTYNTNYLQDFQDEFGGSIGFIGLSASAYYGWNHAAGAETVPYTYFDLGWSGEVFGALIGRYQTDPKDSEDKASYNYFELSAGGEVATLDMSVTYGKRFSYESKATNGKKAPDAGNDYIVLNISKTFSL